MAAALGIRIYKIGLVWPLEEEGARAFADGLETVLVVEERRDVIEHQLRAAAYGLADGRRPRILGKRDALGAPLVSDVHGHRHRPCRSRHPSHHARGVEDATACASTRRALSKRQSLPPRRRCTSARPITARAARTAPLPACPKEAAPMAGIGCHFLATLMNRNTDSYTQMGGEGVLWVGQAPFTSEEHIFANIGDGTYFHSGSLAIRQAIAAGHNITYKILYNDAVAMTGGQPVDGQLSVPQIAAQMRAEGVTRIAIVSDDPDRFRGNPAVPPGVTFDHRSRLDAVQRELREAPASASSSTIRFAPPRSAAAASAGSWNNRRGASLSMKVSVKVAAIAPAPPTAFRSSRSKPSSAASARSTSRPAIRISSCADGFCPSFVSVYGGSLRREKPKDHEIAELPEPRVPAIGADGYNILMTGIGGLGVTSLAAILGMAAHLHNRQVRVVDQIGLAQKGGGVYSHVRIGEQGSELFASAHRSRAGGSGAGGRHRRRARQERLADDERRSAPLWWPTREITPRRSSSPITLSPTTSPR